MALVLFCLPSERGSGRGCPAWAAHAILLIDWRAEISKWLQYILIIADKEIKYWFLVWHCTVKLAIFSAFLAHSHLFTLAVLPLCISPPHYSLSNRLYLISGWCRFFFSALRLFIRRAKEEGDVRPGFYRLCSWGNDPSRCTILLRDLCWAFFLVSPFSLLLHIPL